MLDQKNNNELIKNHKYEFESISNKIIGAAIEVHKKLGPGFVESIYHNALKVALEEEGLKYDTEKVFHVNFDEKKVGSFKLDLIIEDSVVVELKALTGSIPDVFRYQILSYLKISGIKVF